MRKNIIKLNTGVIIVLDKNDKIINIQSAILKENPFLNLTIKKYNNVKKTKIKSIATPNSFISFNDWKKKFKIK